MLMSELMRARALGPLGVEKCPERFQLLCARVSLETRGGAASGDI